MIDEDTIEHRIMCPDCSHVFRFTTRCRSDDYKAIETKLSVAIEALAWADEFFTARDEMNAKVHCAPLRLSPITALVKQALAKLKDEGEE